jgi:hypothetical protein
MSLFYLRKADPEILGRLLAHNRVQRGIAWLNEHAFPGWYLRFFHLLPSGQWVCRANDRYENEAAISIAFETQSHFADKHGYVTKPILLKTFRLSDDRRKKDRARILGFKADLDFTDYLRAKHKAPPRRSRIVTSEMLDEAWSDGVFRIHYNRMFTIRHESIFDRQIDRAMKGVLEDLAELLHPSLPGRVKRFWRRFRTPFPEAI